MRREPGGRRAPGLEPDREWGTATEPSPAELVTQSYEVAGRGPATTMEFQRRPVPLQRGLSALRYRDFRLFWIGQLVSLIGTWMQIVAQNWLVLVLTGSALALGLVSALQFLPILAFSLLGGVIADRLPRRTLLLITQSAAMVLALVLGVLTATGLVRFGHVLVLAVLLGFVNALDMPTRQAFVVELVGPQDLQNAIALNSAVFNSARLIGPAMAGLAIGWVGLAGCFYLNAASFVAVIAVLVFIRAGRLPATHGVETGSVWEDLLEGLRYAAHTPLVRLILLVVAIVGTFGMNMNVLIPLLARDVLGVGAQGFGLLTSAMGVGSLVAALLLAYRGLPARPSVLLVSAAALGAFETALAAIRAFWPAALVLGGIGFSMILFTTLANTLLQTATPDVLRGRVMSLYTTVFAGTTPIGSLFAGALAEHGGVGSALAWGGIISVAAALLGFRLAPRDREPG